MFDRDTVKRNRNLARHRLDLTDAQLRSDGRPVVDAPSPRDGEMRFVTTGWYRARFRRGA